MLERLGQILFGGRRRRDEAAWRTWLQLGSYRLATLPPQLGSVRAVGRVTRIYQAARRGSKALVDFGDPIGLQDTWWEHTRPPVGAWVVVDVHLWLPPGTHSDEQVIWVDAWAATFTPAMHRQAMRHQRRMRKHEAETSPVQSSA